MLTRDDLNSDTAKRISLILTGIAIFYAMVEGSTIAFRFAHGTPSFLGEPQALWRGYILCIIITSIFTNIPITISAKKSIPKIEPFLRKLCHNDSYWLCIFTIVLITYTILFVACPDSLTIFDRFTHM